MWRYIIVNYNNVTQEMADIGGYTSPEYMCKINNNQDIIVKWKGITPVCLKKYPTINKIKIIELLNENTEEI